MAAEAGAADARRSELRTRVISAAVLAPVALAAMYLGGLPFAVLVVAVAAIAFLEWTGMTGAVEPAWMRFGSLLCLLAGLLFLAFADPESGPDWAVGLLALPAFLSLIAGFWRRPFLWNGLGLVYVATPCAGFIVLRQPEPQGWTAILFIVLVVWATDTGAYFGGRSIGGAKLWPRVSPKKTWSGALVGLAAAMVVGAIAGWLGGVWLVTGLLIAAALSVAAQAGDLLESAVKRRFQVKDSGHVIPGHGGVLDRIDGLFAAAALAWLIAGFGLGGELLALPHDIVDASEIPG